MTRLSCSSKAFKEGIQVYGITVSSAIRRYLPTYHSSRYTKSCDEDDDYNNNNNNNASFSVMSSKVMLNSGNSQNAYAKCRVIHRIIANLR